MPQHVQTLLAVAVGGMALAGCIHIDVEETVVSDSSCYAGRYEKLVGLSERQIDPAALPTTYRIIPHGGMGTMDYRPDRLTILLDKDGRVESARCG